MKIKLNYGVCIWDPYFKKDTEIRKINSEERIKKWEINEMTYKNYQENWTYLKKDEGEFPNTCD